MLSFKFLCIMILVSVMSFAQQQVPRDTSFTIQSTFAKEKKHRPYIEIARPEMNEGITSLKGQFYKKTGAGYGVMHLEF